MSFILLFSLFKKEVKEILEGLIRENKELQNIYLDFKRQILRILLPSLPVNETKSAGEILDIIKNLKIQSYQANNFETKFSNNVLSLIYDLFFSFLKIDFDENSS